MQFIDNKIDKNDKRMHNAVPGMYCPGSLCVCERMGGALGIHLLAKGALAWKNLVTTGIYQQFVNNNHVL